MGKRGNAPRKFTAEFKAAALQRLREETLRGRTQTDVARALGVSVGVLCKWRQLAEQQPAPSVPGESLEAEVRRLRREVETLRLERDFAKKAAAYFARDVP
jgi:transposase